MSHCALRALVASLALMGSSAHAQLQAGDFLLSRFGNTQAAALERYDVGGNLIWHVPATSTGNWLGAALTPSGRIAVTRRTPVNGIDLFDASGARVASFDTPQVTGATGEVSVFSDGTLAVCDQAGNVDLFTSAGVYTGTISAPGLTLPFANYVDANDVLFVCDDNAPGSIWKFDQSGALLATLPLSFRPGDVLSAPDGTLWARNALSGAVVHLSASGSVLFSFPVPNNILACWGIALAGDGTLFTCEYNSTQLRHYDQNGTLLGVIPLAPGTEPVFITIVGCGAAPTPYCTAKTNSLGCVPAIGYSGLPSASATSGFVIRATNVLNNKSGLIFYGVNGRTSLPFQGGTLCVKTPLKRSSGVISGGTPHPANDCSGVFALDLNTFAHGSGPPVPLAALTVPGTVVDTQWWGRDPGFSAPNNTMLSDALEYTVCPR